MTGIALPTGTCSGTPQLCSSYSYDNDNRVLTITFPGGASQNYSYDNAGNLKTALGKDSTGTVQTGFTYGYVQSTSPTVDRGIRFSVTENDPSTSNTNVITSYSYGPLLQLMQASNSQHTWSYTYDGAGNRLTDPNGSYQFNSANELCGSSCSSPSYRYDKNGNLTSGPNGGSLSYNAQNQTTSINWNGQSLTGLAYAGAGETERTAAGSASFASSPMGLQESSSPSGYSYFLRDPSGNVIGEEAPGDYHWYYLKDGLGSIVAVVDQSGAVQNRYSYDPYGKASSSGSASNPLGFAGGYLDSTGLVKFGARYYDPSLGRWTQADPAGLVPAFVYARGDPVMNTDPSGLFSYGWCMTISAGWGPGAMLSECVATTNFRQFGGTATVGSGGQSPGASLTYGSQYSNANSLADLSSWFGYGNFGGFTPFYGLGGNVGVFGGNGVMGGSTNLGIGVPGVDLSGGASYTWVRCFVGC